MNEKRPPDYLKILDFGTYKISMGIWIHEDRASLAISTFEDGKWTQKFREEFKRWSQSQ